MSRRKGVRREVVSVELRTENMPWERGTRTVWITSRFFDITAECGHEHGRYASTNSPRFIYCKECRP